MNVGISVNPSKKYGIRQAVIDWYAESLKYMYERTNKLMASSKQQPPHQSEPAAEQATLGN